MDKPDPYAEIRNKRMDELKPEQRDLAHEMWLRENFRSFASYHWARTDSLFPSVLRYIDRLRGQIATLDAPQGEPLSRCGCGARAASECPGQWESGCALGADERFVAAVEPVPLADVLAVPQPDGGT